jgi:hypothetical protein
MRTRWQEPSAVATGRMRSAHVTATWLMTCRVLEVTDFKGNAWSSDFTLDALKDSFVRLLQALTHCDPCKMCAATPLGTVYIW